MQAKDILQLEKDLSFRSFDHEDAYHIASMIIERVKKEHLKNIRIRVVFNHDIVFQYLMNGKNGDLWLNRKQKTVETFQHSSYYVFLDNKENGSYQAYEEDETLAICGGGFPIIVEHQIVGSIIVSGLAHEEDHQLIVDALKIYKNNQKCALASDIDGTLFSPELETSYKAGDLKAIQRFQKAGYLFGVCTGRPYYSLLDMQKDLDIDFYIASSGALILNRSLEIIDEQPMTFEVAKKLYQAYHLQAKVIIHTLNTKGIYKNVESGTNKAILINDFDELKKEKIYSMSIVVEDEQTAKLITKDIHEEFKELEGFQNKNAVDVVKRGCSKGNGIEKIKEILNIDKIAGIGDSYNDISLIKASDTGFTFHSSPQVIQNQVQYIVESIEEAIAILMEE